MKRTLFEANLFSDEVEKPLSEKGMFGMGDLDFGSREGVEKSINNIMGRMGGNEAPAPKTYIVTKTESLRYPGTQIQAFESGDGYTVAIDIPNQGNYAVKASGDDAELEIIDDISELGEDIGQSVDFKSIPQELQTKVLDDLNNSRW